MIPRNATPTLERLAKGFPVVVITGPRQSGKTTLAKSVFSSKTYVSLENPDERAFALQDPKRFLQRFPQGAVLDEVHRCPELLSWLQAWVDERGVMGDFVLTGSAQFDLLAGVTQSLAGRVGRIELLPLSLHEMAQHRGLNALQAQGASDQSGPDGDGFVFHAADCGAGRLLPAPTGHSISTTSSQRSNFQPQSVKTPTC